MAIQEVQLKNFRCFANETFTFSSPVTIIQGDNGTGKKLTARSAPLQLLLAIIRTHMPAELMRISTLSFFIRVKTASDSITIGVTDKRRALKLNESPVVHYKDLITGYKMVTFTEDDLMVIQGYPEGRRALIDDALALIDPDYHGLQRSLRAIIAQRNQLLQMPVFDHSHYELWSQELFRLTQAIVEKRLAYLARLQEMVELTAAAYGTPGLITLSYLQKRKLDESYTPDHLMRDERASRRTLYGPHMDDLVIALAGQHTRTFASRGQQKLAILILKIARTRLLPSQGSVIFLIDDFMTDFDSQRITKLFNLFMGLNAQLIVTTPQQHDLLDALCGQVGALHKILL